MTLTVTLYTRPQCHLCDEVKEELVELQNKFPHHLLEMDIEQDEDLLEAYATSIPVVEVGPYRLVAPIDRKQLQVTLGAATDRVDQLEAVGDVRHQKRVQRAATVSNADRLSYWFSNRYLLVFNLLVFLYVGIPFLAPVLMNAGARAPATLIYRAYGAVCHQLSFRSWFLFGEQPVYPREAAGLNDAYTSFGDATGIDEEDLFTARNFVGNDQIGYKIAFCERDVAIYGGILLFGLLFAALSRRIPTIPWYLWILVGILPIALDGFSQLLSQPPFNLWAYRESTPLLRTLTGFLFGFTTAWFGYPQVEFTMKDTRRILAHKFARLASQPEGADV
jgi:uncharacterized membrane protein